MTGLAALPMSLFLVPVELWLAWMAWQQLRDRHPTAAALLGLPCAIAGVLSLVVLVLGGLGLGAAVWTDSMDHPATLILLSTTFLVAFLMPFAHALAIGGAGAALGLVAWELRGTPLDEREQRFALDEPT